MDVMNTRDQLQHAICATTATVLSSLEQLQDLPLALRLGIEEAVETAWEVAYRPSRTEARRMGCVLAFRPRHSLEGEIAL